jgi:hypothetical protein
MNFCHTGTTMQNDNLGQFPTPNTSSTPLSAPSTAASQEANPLGGDNFAPNTPQSDPTPPQFEETPDEIPTSNPINEPDLSEPRTNNYEPATPQNDPLPEPITNNQEPITPQIDPIPATLPSNASKSPFPSLIGIVLLVVAGLGISGSVFLYSQSSALKKQLTDITQTLERQKNVITPSPTPTSVEIPTPTITITPTIDLSITPTATPTATPTIATNKTIMPIALAPQALKVGINHEPNAQLILIKAENAQDPAKSQIKYYFRNSLTTKKYFYVSVNGQNESEVVDKSIYVNPDNNIPTLNDLVLGNKLGIDYDEAYLIAEKLCLQTLCTNSTIKAQFIKSGDKTIWQLSLTPADTTKETLVIQIDSKTKEVLFKSPAFN